MKAVIGIIGGSGFYKLLKNPKEVSFKTPFGLPSEKIALGEISGKMVAFLPRHGAKHQFPPHKIPYQYDWLSGSRPGAGIRTLLLLNCFSDRL